MSEMEHAEGVLAEEHHGHVNYARTWVYLLILTVLEVGIVLLGLPQMAIAIGLITFTLLKAYFIFSDFMHLKFERIGIVVIALSSLVFGVLLFLGTVPDFIR